MQRRKNSICMPWLLLYFIPNRKGPSSCSSPHDSFCRRGTMDVHHRRKDRSINHIFPHTRRINAARNLLVVVLIAQGSAAQSPAVNLPFNFKQCLYTEARTLSSFVASLDAESGEVVLNGYDGRRPASFTFDWGDGTARETGGFEMRHSYRSTARNYGALRHVERYGKGARPVYCTRHRSKSDNRPHCR
jgi:hypothetical protein